MSPTDDELTAIVQRELGATPEWIRRVDGGLLHETYELNCNGEEYVLQFSSSIDDGRTDSIERGLYCYLLLQHSEVPVPDPVTKRLKEYGGREYVLVEKLPGETGEQALSPEKTRNAGRYLAMIHGTKTFETAGWIEFEDTGPTVREFREGSLDRHLQQRVVENATIMRAGGMEQAGDTLQQLFEQIGEKLPAEFQPVLCHADYSPDNVLFADGNVTGILDFDRACASHNQHDVVQAANAFWMHDPCADWDVRDTFYSGYRDVTPLAESFQRTEPIYRAETLTNTVAGLLELDSLTAYESDFYAERILESIERAERRYGTDCL